MRDPDAIVARDFPAVAPIEAAHFCSSIWKPARRMREIRRSRSGGFGEAGPSITNFTGLPGGLTRRAAIGSLVKARRPAGEESDGARADTGVDIPGMQRLASVGAVRRAPFARAGRDKPPLDMIQDAVKASGLPGRR